MKDLLIELGCEELPAASVEPMARHLGDALHAVLVEAGLAGGEARGFGTPRRIAAILAGAGDRQQDRAVERRGPALAAAFENGEFGGTPTRALQGFLKSAGARLADLSTVETDKGAWVQLSLSQPGRTLDEIVAEALPEVLRTLPMPRRMRWGDGSDEFLRPVVWLLAMHGERVLKVNALGLVAGRETRGHRVHSPGPHSLATAADYLPTLERAYVLADIAARRAFVLEGVQREAAVLGGLAVADDALVDEVTALVEWPIALAGRFEKRFLEIPKEALIQTMQENQRYFALLDDAGELMPAFVTVANLASSDPQIVIDGNERVIRPRFDDTMFFWRQDLERTLESRLPELDRVLFEKRLGSIGDKVRRLEVLAKQVAPMLGADPAKAARAATLAKCDLVSALVEELAKMQGIAGHHYALRDGESVMVARAVEQHYWPKQSGTPLPDDAIGQTVALVDRLDTLVGIFGIGMKPTGTKDPFALRRAAIGILRLSIEGGHSLDLAALVDTARAAHGELPAFDAREILDFLSERLRALLTGAREGTSEGGHPVDVVDAVLARTSLDPYDVALRVEATRTFRQRPEAASLAAASKRVGNILRKSDEAVPAKASTALLVDDAEHALAVALLVARETVQAALDTRDYAAAMSATATLAEPVDRYFEQVLVNAEDEALRRNRLATLAELDRLCNAVVDLSRLQPAAPQKNVS